jgi:hypothetical protein
MVGGGGGLTAAVPHGYRHYNKHTAFYNTVGKTLCYQVPCAISINTALISVPLIRVGPPGHFIHISITTPVVSALKNYYR